MSQLSPFSQHLLSKIQNLLLEIELLLKTGKLFLLKKIPQIADSIAYAAVMAKDILSFVPPYLYKIITLVIVVSFIAKYSKKKKNPPTKQSKQNLHLLPEEQPLQKQIQKGLEQLGPEYEVKKSLGPTGQQTLEEQDSCCQDLTQQLHQTHDFRDIVFFQLMRSYSNPALQQESQLHKN